MDAKSTWNPRPTTEMALRLARRGWVVFPLDHPDHKLCRGIGKDHDAKNCPNRGKDPTVLWRHRTGSSDSVIKDWFNGKKANLAISCGPSGLLVVDEDAADEFARYAKSVGQTIPETMIVKTGKGLHYYFRQPEGEPLGNKEGALGDYGVNVRGAGGYVVGPTSKHRSGAIYELVNDVEPAPCPEWLVEALRTAQKKTKGDLGELPSSGRWWRDDPVIPEGKRHAALVAAAGWARERRLTRDEALPLMRDVLARCDLTDGRYGLADALEKLDDVYTRYEPSEGDQPAPGEFWTHTDRLRELHDFARGRMVSPWALLGSVLATVVTRIGPHVTLPPIVGHRASLNLLVGLVGPSGAGKTSALAVASDLLWMSEDEVPTHELGTGQGITSAYTRPPRKDEVVNFCDSALFVADEVGSLAAHGAMKGANLMSVLKSAFSGAQLGARYADEARRRPVLAHRYRFALVAGVQPAHAGAILDDVDGGFPQRWLLLPAIDPDAPDEPGEPPLPGSGFVVPDELAAVGVNEDGVVAKDAIELAVFDGAWTQIRATRLGQLRDQATDPMHGHRLLLRLKTAAVLALWHNEREVTEQWWEVAGAVVAVSDSTRKAAQREISSRERDRRRAQAKAEDEKVSFLARREDARVLERVVVNMGRRVERHHQTHEDGLCTRQCLTRAVAGRDKARVDMDQAIEEAAKRGLIVAKDAGWSVGR